MDETGAHYTEESKPEYIIFIYKIHTHTHICSLCDPKIWVYEFNWLEILKLNNNGGKVLFFAIISSKNFSSSSHTGGKHK